MYSAQTIFDVIKYQAEANPDQVAMVVQGYPSLRYGRLLTHLCSIAATLRAQGIHRCDRVALVLPNGPAMATAFLGTTISATCAPLNPDYRADEIDFYLSDLNAKLIIIQSDLDSPARDIAKQKGIPVLDLIPQPEDAVGLFRFADQACLKPSSDLVSKVSSQNRKNNTIDYAEAEDIALVLHTSGTTSRPKIVPLTHRNICTSVQTICQSLQLTAADRCETGTPLPPGDIGEIAIRGDNVITAYENNPTANASTFTAGWFRTGDLGYLDNDGNLYLQGRSKEIINRGGQKISPAEVDAVLMQHPTIHQVVTFALPHRSLGEEVAAAIVANANTDITTAEITAFATERLAHYKVPRVIRLVDSIPKGPTGKLQRIGLANQLNLVRDHQDDVLPETLLETQLVKICEQMLGLSDISVQDNFFEIGGNSLLAVRFCAEVTQRTQHPLSTSALLGSQSFRELAQAITKPEQLPPSSLHVIHAKGTKPPLFTINATGNFLRLLPWMDEDQPIYSLNIFGISSVLVENLESLSLADIAQWFIRDLRTVYPDGPYQFLTFCQDGPLALEIAQQLRQQGADVDLVCLIDSFFSPLKSDLRMRLDNLMQLGWRYLYLTVKKRWRQFHRANRRIEDIPLEERLQMLGKVDHNQKLYKKYIELFFEYEPQAYSGPIVLLLSQEWRLVDLSKLEQIAADKLDVRLIKGMHNYLFDRPYIQYLAQAINNVLLA